jgi:hypothetical protein
MYQISNQNGYKIYEHFSFQVLPKYTRIGIFGMQTSHVATARAKF